MFISNLNESKAILACRYAHPYSPADYDAYQAAFLEVVAAARKHKRTIVLFIDLEDAYPSPNAVQRKNIGEAWGRVPDVGGVIAIVSSSVLIRGIITAVEWFMQNSPNRRETKTFPRPSDAVAWLAEQSGVPASELNASIEAMQARHRGQKAAS